MSNSDNINLSPGTWNNPVFNRVTSLSSYSTGQTFLKKANSVILSGATANITAESLLNDIYHHGESTNITFNLPTVGSVYSYLASTYGISNPPPVGISFKFKIANKATANTVTISINGDVGWILNLSVGSGVLPSDSITIAAATTREFTCRVPTAGQIQVIG